MRLLRKNGAEDEPPAGDCGACEQRHRRDQAGRAEDDKIGVRPGRATPRDRRTRSTVPHPPRRASRTPPCRDAAKGRPERRRSRALHPTRRTGARSNPGPNPSTGGTRKTAATPPNAGAARSATPASTSASTRSGASVAALRQSANVTRTTCSQNQIHPRCSRSSARSPAIATARSEDVNSENSLSTALSRMRASHEIQPLQQPFVRLQGAGERLHACSRDRHVALRPPASLWSRFAHPRRDQGLGLEPLERGVQRTRRDGASRTIRQFRPNRHPVGVIVESQNGKEDQLFELADLSSFNASALAADDAGRPRHGLERIDARLGEILSSDDLLRRSARRTRAWRASSARSRPRTSTPLRSVRGSSI